MSSTVIAIIAQQRYKKLFGISYYKDYKNPQRNQEYQTILDDVGQEIGDNHVDATGYPIVEGDKLAVAVTQGDSCALRIGIVKAVSHIGVQLELDCGRKQTYKAFERMVVVR